MENNPTSMNGKPKIAYDFYNTLTQKVFFDRKIMKNILSFLNDNTKVALKNCFKKTGCKDRKKQTKEFVKKYVIDVGKHFEKLTYRLNENNKLVISTNIFNLNKNFLKEFDKIYHKETEDKLELEKNELFEYLKVYQKFEFYLTNNSGDHIKLSKAIIPYEDEDAEENDPEKKYELFYNSNDFNNLNLNDFSKDGLIERQKKILEIMNAEKNKVFYPLEFICNVNYWSIILCHGGYFAVGFFLRDKLLDHKSDHKYVTRKKAGQRQINKDKAKKIKTSGKILFFKF